VLIDHIGVRWSLTAVATLGLAGTLFYKLALHTPERTT
jgi:hypothetical protein